MPSPVISASPDTSPSAATAVGLRHSLLRGFAGVGATRVVQMVVSLLVSVLLARTLGPEQFGYYTFVLAAIGLCALPAYAGLSAMLVREVARYDAQDDGALAGSSKWSLIAALWMWSLRIVLWVGGVGALLAVGYFTLSAAAPTSMGVAEAASVQLSPLLITLLGVCVVLMALARVGVALLQGLRRVVVATLPETVIRPGLLLVLLVALLLVGRLDTINALLCFVAATFCAGLYTLFLLRGVRANCNASAPVDAPVLAAESTRWRTALGPFTGIAAVGYLNTELFVPLVALFADSSEVAYFKIALSLALLVALPLTLVESVIKPQVTRLFEAGDGRRLQQLVSRAGWGALALSLPALGLFGLFGEQIVERVFGVSFSGAIVPMIILAVGFAVVNLVGPSMQLLYATRYEKDALVISMLSLAGVVLLSIAMIPTYGAVGAAAAFAIAKVFRAVAFRFWASRRLHSLFNASV